MLRGLCVWATLVAFVGAAAPRLAEARKKSHRRAVAHATHKITKKVAKRVAKKIPKKIPNMPIGWAWPPTAAMREDGRACLQDLGPLGVHWLPGPPAHAINTPVLVPDMIFAGLSVKRTRSKGPVVMDCTLARALARDAAPVLAQLHITELHVGQIHADRDVGTRPGVLSRHSLGLAVDVYGFVTEDGREHLVEQGYLAGDPTLHLVELLLGRTGAFRTLMTPGNDPGPHYNHFHIEARALEDKIVPRLTRGADRGLCTVVDVVTLASPSHAGLGFLRAFCP